MKFKTNRRTNLRTYHISDEPFPCLEIIPLNNLLSISIRPSFRIRSLVEVLFLMPYKDFVDRLKFMCDQDSFLL